MPTIADIRQQYPMYSDMSDGELVRGLHKKFYADIPYQDFLRKIDFSEKVNPTDGMSNLQKFNAGAGKALYDIGQGAAQLVGAGESGAQTKARKELDAPLMRTAGGVTGNLLGNMTAFAPALVAAPATIPAAAGIGMTMGALRPAESVGDRLGNMATDAAVAGGMQAAVGPGAQKLGEWAANKEAQAAQMEAQNAVRDAALKAGREAGYVVPPATANPTLLNKTLESIPGKQAMEQAASVKNQQVTDALARESLGLGPTSVLSEKGLQDLRNQAAAPYRQIKDLPGKVVADQDFSAMVKKIGGDYEAAIAEFPNSTKNVAIDDLKKDLEIGSWSPKAVLEKVKQLRFDASKNFNAFDSPEKLALARAQRSAAEALDSLLGRNLMASGNGQLANEYAQARQFIAKTHDVEAALLPDGHVSAKILSKIGEDAPLSGQLKTISDFSGSFKKATKNLVDIGSPETHNLKTWVAAAGGATGAAMGGPIGGALGAAAPFVVPPAARAMLLSDLYQGALATPSYSPGVLLRAAKAVVP